MYKPVDFYNIFKNCRNQRRSSFPTISSEKGLILHEQNVSSVTVVVGERGFEECASAVTWHSRGAVVTLALWACVGDGWVFSSAASASWESSLAKRIPGAGGKSRWFTNEENYSVSILRNLRKDDPRKNNEANSSVPSPVKILLNPISPYSEFIRSSMRYSLKVSCTPRQPYCG